MSSSHTTLTSTYFNNQCVYCVQLKLTLARAAAIVVHGAGAGGTGADATGAGGAGAGATGAGGAGAGGTGAVGAAWEVLGSWLAMTVTIPISLARSALTSSNSLLYTLTNRYNINHHSKVKPKLKPERLQLMLYGQGISSVYMQNVTTITEI